MLKKKKKTTKQDSKPCRNTTSKNIQILGKSAILVFNLPDNKYDYELASKAWSYYAALDDIHQWLRLNTKYGISTDLKDAIEKKASEYDEPNCKETIASIILWEVRDKLAQIISERNAYEPESY